MFCVSVLRCLLLLDGVDVLLDVVHPQVDLAGHEKYLRTTCFGLTGHLPDYGMVIIGANAGLVGSACLCAAARRTV